MTFVNIFWHLWLHDIQLEATKNRIIKRRVLFNVMQVNCTSTTYFVNRHVRKTEQWIGNSFSKTEPNGTVSNFEFRPDAKTNLNG
jgi:hypothetical protein